MTDHLPPSRSLFFVGEGKTSDYFSNISLYDSLSPYFSSLCFFSRCCCCWKEGCVSSFKNFLLRVSLSLSFVYAYLKQIQITLLCHTCLYSFETIKQHNNKKQLNITNKYLHIHTHTRANKYTFLYTSSNLRWLIFYKMILILFVSSSVYFFFFFLFIKFQHSKREWWRFFVLFCLFLFSLNFSFTLVSSGSFNVLYDDDDMFN